MQVAPPRAPLRIGPDRHHANRAPAWPPQIRAGGNQHDDPAGHDFNHHLARRAGNRQRMNVFYRRHDARPFINCAGHPARARIEKHLQRAARLRHIDLHRVAAVARQRDGRCLAGMRCNGSGNQAGRRQGRAKVPAQHPGPIDHVVDLRIKLGSTA
jgi:hypothetical protein